MNKNEYFKMRRSILISIPILFIISGPLHFLFDFTGELKIIGAFSPVNESPWEHLKLVFFPIFVWWIIYYFRSERAEKFSKVKWIVSTAVAIISAPLTIVMFFYSYTGAFGTEFLPLDILSTLLAITVGQYLAYHIYRYSSQSKFSMYVSLVIIITLVFIFVFFTFSPPQIPLFIDRNTGGVGIP